MKLLAFNLFSSQHTGLW